MEKLEKTESWTPNAIDSTDAGLADADRLPHRARDRLRPRQGAAARRSPSSRQRSTYFHEADSVIGFVAAERTRCRDRARPASRKAVSNINFLFNWAYVDSEHIAYALSGWLPAARARAPRPTSRSSAPASTTGRASSPRPQTRELPAVRPSTRRRSTRRFLVSWNNKQAPGWAAADDKYAYGPLLPLADDLRQGQARRPRAAKKMTHRPARPGDGGTGDAGPARLPAAADRSSRRSASRSSRSCAGALATLQRLAASAAPTGATSTATASTRKTPRSS